jgi:hypothetical protein
MRIYRCLFEHVNFSSFGDPGGGWAGLSAKEQSGYQGACICHMGTYLEIDECYFYQIHSSYPGAIVYSMTQRPPRFTRLNIRSCHVRTDYSFPPDTEGRAGASFNGAFFLVECPVAGSTGAPEENTTTFFNDSSLLRTWFERARSSQDQGGYSFETIGSVLAHCLNMTLVDGTANGGLLFRVTPWLVSVNDRRMKFCQMYECSNDFLGSVSIFR